MPPLTGTIALTWTPGGEVDEPLVRDTLVYISLGALALCALLCTLGWCIGRKGDGLEGEERRMMAEEEDEYWTDEEVWEEGVEESTTANTEEPWPDMSLRPESGGDHGEEGDVMGEEVLSSLRSDSRRRGFTT